MFFPLLDVMHGHDNPTFIGDIVYSITDDYRNRNLTEFYPGKYQRRSFPPEPSKPLTNLQQVKDVKDVENAQKSPKERDSWGKGIEFLLSCIAMSVGLGNIWRFPFIALENGGGKYKILVYSN
jgi:Sodium:neurotransmitter symporter family